LERWPQSSLRRHADGSRSDVVVSVAVDSGREIRHGNIDANDPKRALQDSPVVMPRPLPAWYRLAKPQLRGEHGEVRGRINCCLRL
jgi:hypothetical protein